MGASIIDAKKDAKEKSKKEHLKKQATNREAARYEPISRKKGKEIFLRP